MLHVCMWRDLCSKIACCVVHIAASHNTHPRATRSQHDSTAARDPGGPSACAPIRLRVRLRLRWPPLAGGAPWSPTRDHGPCEARAKELHQEEQRARLADRRLFVASPALKICGQLLRVARVAALCVGNLPWEYCHALFVAFVGLDISASIFSAAWTCIEHCGTVEPPQPQARRRAPRR